MPLLATQTNPQSYRKSSEASFLLNSVLRRLGGGFGLGATIWLGLSSLASAASRESAAEARKEAHARWDYVLDQFMEMGWSAFIFWGLVCTLVAFLIFWPASRLLAREEGSMRLALNYYTQLTVISLIYVAVAVFCIRTDWLGLLGLLTLGVLIASVRIAMNVYEMTVLPAIGMAVMALVASGMGQVVGEMIAGPTPLMALEGKSDEQRKDLIAKWQDEKRRRGKGGSTMTSTSSVPGSNLQQLYADLQTARAALNPNDPAAVARFNEQVAVYNAAKAAATPVATPLPSPTATAAPASPIPVAKAVRVEKAIPKANE